MDQPLEEAADDFGMEKLECKICYCAYSKSGWQPEVLECHHHLCAKCLAKIIDLSESSPRAVVCPFCRYVTNLPACRKPANHYNMWMELSTQSCHLHESQLEILHTPGQAMADFTSTSPFSAQSNNMIITTVHPPQDPAVFVSRDRRSSNLDYVVSFTWPWMVWRGMAMLYQTLGWALVWLVGLLHFGSLPLGVYMLIIQETTWGMLLVCLVPVSLFLSMLYGICHCMCHEFWNCVWP